MFRKQYPLLFLHESFARITKGERKRKIIGMGGAVGPFSLVPEGAPGKNASWAGVPTISIAPLRDGSVLRSVDLFSLDPCPHNSSIGQCVLCS